MGLNEAVTGKERAERWLDQYLGSPETRDNLAQMVEDLADQFAIAEGEASQLMKEAVATRVLDFAENIRADAQTRIEAGETNPTMDDTGIPLNLLFGAARAVAQIVLDTPLEVPSQRRAAKMYRVPEGEDGEEEEVVDLERERIMRDIHTRTPIARVQIMFFEAQTDGQVVHALGFDAPSGIRSPHDWLVGQLEQVLHGLRMAEKGGPQG